MDVVNWFSLLYVLSLLLIISTRVHCDSKDSYTFPDGVTLRDGDEFEYIVVGAGGAGAPAASRLALAGARVLLVEAGGDPSPDSKIPSMANSLPSSNIAYQYKTISNRMSCLSSPNCQCQFGRGKCLGGSTSINGMIYTRGSPQDFDDLNIIGWAWNDIKPYFLRYEGLQDLDFLPRSSIPFHNTTGTMKMEFFSVSHNPWHSRLIEGMMSLNFPFNPDVNAKSQIGVTQVIGYVYNSERMSTARGYLARNDVKSKLMVAKNTTCTGVIIDDDNVARGVTVVIDFGQLQSQLRLYATKEVILSAGAIATPQILMLSGIGPAGHLRNMKVPVRVDLPVGDDMIDHASSVIYIKVQNSTKNDSLAGNVPLDLTDINAFVNTICYDFDKRQLTNEGEKCLLPTTQFVSAYVDRNVLPDGKTLGQNKAIFGNAVSEQLSDVNANYPIIIISPVVLYPHSRGTVRLASRDPLAAPAIFPNYLSDERDLEEMIRSFRIVEHLVETPVFKAQNASIIRLKLAGCPEYEAGSEEYWRCYARHVTQTIYHAAGTTALGRVVDERLRVLGVPRLRVADLGVLPRPTRANTASSAIAIGEKLADLILEDNDMTLHCFH